METNISQILKIPAAIICCGRTDALVHASQFFFHIDIENTWDFDLMFRLNKNLPDDIAVFDILPMEGLPHARFDATKRTYDYFFHTYKDPFLGNFSTLFTERNLNFEKMRDAATLLLQYNDYKAFCRAPLQYRTTICNVTEARFFADSTGDKFRFQISANRFLGNMVRILVGKLFLVGNGSLTIEEFENMLKTKESPKILKPAFPQGLYLSKVSYPYLDLPTRTKFLGLVNQEEKQWNEV